MPSSATIRAEATIPADPNIPTMAMVPPAAVSPIREETLMSPTASLLKPTTASLDVQATGAAQNLASGKMGEYSIPSSSRGTTAASVQTVGSVSVAPLSVAQDRVAQRNSSNDTATNKTNSREVSRIAAASERQVALLEEIVQNQDELYRLFTQPRSGAPAGNTGGNSAATAARTADHPEANFATWGFGKFHGNASKGVMVGTA